MDWGKVQFFLGEVFANFTRNAAMQFTAIGTVAVTIVMLGTFLFVRERSRRSARASSRRSRSRSSSTTASATIRPKRLATTLAADNRDRGRALRSAGRGSARDARAAGQRLRHLAADGEPAAERVSRAGPQRRRRARGRRVDRQTAGRREGRLRGRHGDEAAARRRRASGRVGLGDDRAAGPHRRDHHREHDPAHRLRAAARDRDHAARRRDRTRTSACRSSPKGIIAGVPGALRRDRACSRIAQLQLVPEYRRDACNSSRSTSTSCSSPANCCGVGAAVGLVASWFSVGRYLRA